MKDLVKKYSLNKLKSLLVNNIVNFTSDCQFFPNFNITGKVLSIQVSKNGYYTIQTKVKNKIIDIDINMSNLTFEIMNTSVH